MSRGIASAAARTPDPLQHAIVLQQRGATGEAMSTIEAVLQRQPRNWQALLLLGLMKLQAGDARHASGLLARSAQLQPAHADTHFHLAQALQQLGDGERAEASYRKAAALQPNNWLVHFHLGLLLEESGQTAAAREAYTRAVACNPRSAEALNNLGNVLISLGDVVQAERRLRQAIEVNPALACAHLNLGMLLARDPAREHEALASLGEAQRLVPADAQAHFHMGVLLAARHRYLPAIKAYQRTLELAPEHAEALNNLAVVHLEMWQDELAEEVLARALALRPSLTEGWNNLGNLRLRQGRWRDAKEAYEHALALAPEFVPALTGLGTALSESGDLAAARTCYERALALDPTAAAALAGHAGNLQRLGDLESALPHYHAARARSDNDALRIKAALALRPILLSREDIADQRARLARDVDALQEEGVQVNERELLSYPETCFYLAYHGEHDRDLLQKIAEMMLSACPRLAYTAANAIHPRAEQGCLRIGFVSRFFYRHSVGRFFNPIIADLARRDGFEVVLFSIGEMQDEEMHALADACTKHVRLKPTSLQASRRLIEREQLDLLVYPEIGMDPFTWLLSFSRLARVQCVLQGHSNTSGVPALDYFVSSSLIESDGAQHHYSERLALLPTLPMFLEPPAPAATTPLRARYGLPDQATLYLCPMKLQKVHPDMDGALARILEGDPAAHVVFVRDHANPVWDELLRTRLERALRAHMQRVLFVDWQRSTEDFLGLLSVCDVILDSFHHGGATTSHLALACGKPIVTWATGHGRSGFLPGYYRVLGITDCVAETPDRYVEIALQLGRDEQRRAQLSQRIRSALPKLYDNPSVFDAYAQLFRQLAAGAPILDAAPPPYVPLSTVERYCRAHGQHYEVLHAEREIDVPLPRIAGEPWQAERSHARLPEIYLARLQAIDVIGGESMLLAAEGSIALHDAAVRYPDQQVDIATGAIGHRCEDTVLLACKGRASRRIPRGIHLCGRVSGNYYHWLLEYLPRLQALERCEDLHDWPILVDAELHPNLIAALERVCPGKALIAIDYGERVHVERLVVCGPRAWLPVDYRDGAVARADDILFAPEAIDFLRRRLGHSTGVEGKPRRKLYLRRGKADHRNLIDEEAIEQVFVRRGFEVVCPETLSLTQQIELFSEAAAIAGPSGAAFANMVFAPAGCRILVLYYPGVPYFYFSTLAAALDHDLRYLLGNAVAGSHPVLYQRDFTLDAEKAAMAADAMLDGTGIATGSDAAVVVAAPTRQRLAFLLHIPELANHYRAIWAHLPPEQLEVVNAGVGSAAVEIARLSAQAGINCVPVDSRLGGNVKYPCMVSNHPIDPSGEPLIKRLAHVNVRMMYALGKAGWNLREWNELYDMILCFGPYHAEALAAVTSARIVQVGYPRFDAFFHAQASRQDLAARYGCEPSQRTLVWLPTWSTLSSVATHAAAIGGLARHYNVVVKLHPLMSAEQPEMIEALQALPFKRLITDSSDNVELYRLADVVLCDYGGPAFGAIYTDRPLLLLNVAGAESDPLTGADSPDILIRQVVTNTGPCSAEALAQLIEDHATWEQQTIVRRELRQAFFAPHYGFASQVAAGTLANIEALMLLR